ncbi:hypothetical protein [Aurantibacillus circumpalustris]|uniref:hypothetical protein n=1 Tax=Aurantibacillus circumpalustris TaxID=3036359 RepID=UPI00295A59E9|nr:hypothetical protein [Aurantibacillus circumpalustris]
MRRRVLSIINFLILFGLIALNTYIYFHRNDGFAYKESLNYRQLYELKNNLKIVSIENKATNLIEIQFNTVFPNSKWRVYSASFQTQVESVFPIIKLHEGKHLYTIENLDDTTIPPITLGFNHTASETYQKNKRDRESVTELYYASIPIGNIGARSISQWQKTSPFTTTEETRLARKLISENVSLQKGDSTLIKVKKISAFLLKTLDAHRGIPGDTMNTVSPWVAYNLAIQSKSQIWCGDFTSILSFFLSTESIVTREVCFEGKLDSIYLAGHNLNEVYVPELKKWVLADLTSKAIFITHNSEYLNLLDFYALHKNNAADIEVQTFENDSLFVSDYTEFKGFYDHYLSVAPQFVYYYSKHFDANLYSFRSKWMRYFFKDATFATYSGNSDVDNEKFYVKQMAAITLKLFSLYLIVLYLIIGIQKKQNL